MIRTARPGDEKGIHESHMRSINEICVKDHGSEETKGWGNRPLGNRWVDAILEGFVWVVEKEGEIHGHAYIRIDHPSDGEGNGKSKEVQAHIHGLYLTPEVLGEGWGYKLAKLMIEKAKEKGVSQITLESTLTAHDFYQKLGFKDSGPVLTHKVGGSRVRCFPMEMAL